MKIRTHYKKRVNLYHLLLIFSTIFMCNKTIAQSSPSSLKLRTVVIDAGHGGKDPGALKKLGKGKMVFEKDLVLDVALKLGSLIEKNTKDVKVIYTRKTDKFVALGKRNDIANKSHADLFISLHVDAIGRRTKIINGASTYILGLRADKMNMKVAMRENSVVTMEKDYLSKYGDPNSAETYIMVDMLNNKNRDLSLIAAEIMQKNICANTQFKNHGVREAGFMVLWGATMPSVLVELGFITNPTDFKYITQNRNRKKIASSLFKAFKEYKSFIDAANKKENIKHVTAAKKTFKKTKSLKKIDSLEYAVQFFTSFKKMPRSKFISDHKIYESESNQLFKYITGRDTKMSNVKRTLKKIKKMYPDAFIVKLKNQKLSILK